MKKYRLLLFGFAVATTIASTAATPAAEATAGEAIRDVECGHGQAAAAPPMIRDFDPRTGEDPFHYSPDPLVDYLHMKLELDFPPLDQKRFSGKETLTFKALRGAADHIRLDAIDLAIQHVTDLSGNALGYDYDDREIIIHFDPPLPPQEQSGVIISYECVEPSVGMFFVLRDDAHPNRASQMHTQGQVDDNSHWFPTHDSPNERMTTETIVTVPKPLQVISNGKLLGSAVKGDRITYHYLHDTPHVSYLVSLIVGEFDLVEDKWRDVAVQYFVPQGAAAAARRTFKRTPEMIELFSNLFGVDYPYAKYSQTVVWNFSPGGMENTSATTMFGGILLDEKSMIDQDYDGLVAHELAHQWYGDLLTCKTWAHVWLNEGFASFCDAYWIEHWKGREWYLYDMFRTVRHVGRHDRVEDPDAMVFRDYRHSWDTFRHKGGLPYPKGTVVLNMLRHQLGDDLFFNALKTYTRRFQYRAVETDDFRKVFEEVTGRDFEHFFTQWCYRPGVPHIEIWYKWHPSTKVAEVKFAQTQPVTRETPAFKVPVDLHFRVGDQIFDTTIDIEQREQEFTRHFDARPDLFCVDPQAGLLMKAEIHKPRSMWLKQLTDGPTVPTRAAAAEALARHSRVEVVSALEDVLRDENEFWGVRTQAAQALGKMFMPSAEAALVESLNKGIAEPRTRKAAVGALGNFRSGEAISAVKKLAIGEPSYRVQAAAVRALGKMKALDEFGTVLQNLQLPAQADQLRRAAAGALGDLGDARGIEPLMGLSAYGEPWRTRPAAIGALGKLARRHMDQRDRVREFLEGLLHDPEQRTVQATLRALGESHDEEALPILRHYAETGSNEMLRVVAREAIAKLEKSIGDKAYVQQIRGELDRLRRSYDEIREHLSRMEGDVPDADEEEMRRGEVR